MAYTRDCEAVSTLELPNCPTAEGGCTLRYAHNVSIQYDGGFLPDIILLTQCYYHRGTRLNAMKRFCILSY